MFILLIQFHKHLGLLSFVCTRVIRLKEVPTSLAKHILLKRYKSVHKRATATGGKLCNNAGKVCMCGTVVCEAPPTNNEVLNLANLIN